MATYRLWPSTNGPAAPSADTTDYTLGVEFEVLSPVDFTAWNWWCQTSAIVSFGLYEITSDTTGTLVASVANASVAAGGWRRTPVASPVALAPGTRYRATAFSTTDNFYCSTGQYWAGAGPGAAGITNGPLQAVNVAEATSSDQGSFLASSVQGFPANSFNASNYWIDPEVSDSETESTPVELLAASPRSTSQIEASILNPTSLSALAPRASSSNAVASICLIEMLPTAPRPTSALTLGGVVNARDIHINALAARVSWLVSTCSMPWGPGGTIALSPTIARALEASWSTSKVEAPSKLSPKVLVPGPLTTGQLAVHPLTAGTVEV